MIRQRRGKEVTIPSKSRTADGTIEEAEIVLWPCRSEEDDDTEQGTSVAIRTPDGTLSVVSRRELERALDLLPAPEDDRDLWTPAE